MTILEFFRGVFCTIKGFALACVITLGIITVLKETGLVHAKNIDKPESVVQLTNPLNGTTLVSNEPQTPGFTIPAEMMPKGDTYFVTIIKGQDESDGIWVLDRPLTKATEKAGFALVMEAAKQGDAKHYPLPDNLKPDKEE